MKFIRIAPNSLVPRCKKQCQLLRASALNLKTVAMFVKALGITALYWFGQFYFATVLAYEVNPPVHEWITYQAYLQWPGLIDPQETDPEAVAARREFFNFLPNDPKLIDDLFRFEIVPANWGLASHGNFILQASYEEDYDAEPFLENGDLESGWLASLKHFWDPNGEYDSGLTVVVQHQSAISRANEMWKKALCAYPTDPGAAYYYLGKIAHLLQDLTVPGHVHNDPHISDALCHAIPTQPECDTGDDSSYESFTAWGKRYQAIKGVPGIGWTSSASTFASGTGAIDPAVHVPIDADYNLSKLFYDTALTAKVFDSDRWSADGTALRYPAMAGLAQKGATRKRHSLQITESRLHPFLPGSTEVQQWSVLGVPKKLLQLDVDYWESPWRGRVLLSDAFLVGTDDYFVATFTSPSGVHLESRRIDVIESGDILDSELEKAQMILENTAIRNTSTLFKYFWEQTHPTHASDVIFDCDVSGESAPSSGELRQSGGRGGSIDVRTGIDFEANSVPFANEFTHRFHDGVSPPDAPSGITVLGSGTYFFRQISSTGLPEPIELQIQGDVTIYCQYIFKPDRISAKTSDDNVPASLKVYAGQAVEFTVSGGELKSSREPHGYTGNRASLVRATMVNLSTKSSDVSGPLTCLTRGGSFTFWTSERCGIKGLYWASGGSGRNRGRGGDGGAIKLLASFGAVSGSIGADGAVGGTALTPPSAEDINVLNYCREDVLDAGTEEVLSRGGDGGRVVVSAAIATSSLGISANGGDGGHGFSARRITGENGTKGGRGGNGGLLNFQISQWSKAHTHLQVSLKGGCGGLGGSGAFQPTKKGGNGGDGGSGGWRGVANGVEDHETLQLVLEVEPGFGGRGGQGGGSGSGVQTGGGGGTGGDSGDGFDFHAGEGGEGGLGGGGRGTKGQRGRPSDVPERVLPATPVIATCSHSSQASGLLLKYAPGDNHSPFEIQFSRIPNETHYMLQTSTDAIHWATVTNLFGSFESFRYRASEPRVEPKRFYRVVTP